MKLKILVVSIFVICLPTFFADVGYVVDLNNPTKTPPDFLNINKSNFEEYGYTIEIQLPQSDKPDLKRFHIKFPKTLETNYSYRYSKALYAQEGKTLLSYRPADVSLSSSETGAIYILADKEIVRCISLVNVYHKSDKEYGMHPPSLGVSINLASFLENQEPCKGSLNANNYW